MVVYLADLEEAIVQRFCQYCLHQCRGILNTCAFVCVCVCVCACVRACVRASVRACVRAYVCEPV